MSEQSLYNLASRTIELEVLPACRVLRARRHPVEPARGRHARRHGTGGDTARRKSVQPRYEQMRPQLERWEKFCAELGEEPAAVALAWLLHQKGVTGRSSDRARWNNSKARRCAPLDLTLDDATLATLDEIFPGPGGRAPEAYAW